MNITNNILACFNEDTSFNTLIVLSDIEMRAVINPKDWDITLRGENGLSNEEKFNQNLAILIDNLLEPTPENIKQIESEINEETKKSKSPSNRIIRPPGFGK